jgi:hypothetical protein
VRYYESISDRIVFLFCDPIPGRRYFHGANGGARYTAGPNQTEAYSDREDGHRIQSGNPKSSKILGVQ